MRKAALFVVTLLLFYNCNSVTEIKELSSDGTSSVEITKGVTMYYSDMGNSRMRLVSPEVHRFEDNSNMILECPIGMELTFFDTLENIESVLMANYGKLYTKDHYQLHVSELLLFFELKYLKHLFRIPYQV